jgi:predicted permease
MMSLRKFFRRRHTDAELQEEMSNHLAAEIEDYLACGYSYDEARRAALVKFGNLQQVRERLWRQNTISWLDNLWRNLKQSARSLRRSPGFALVSIGVIALGIGVNAALFTVVRSVLLKPLPFTDPQRLVRLYEDTFDHRFAYNSSAAGIFAEWRKQSHSFSSLAISRYTSYNLSGTGEQLPEKVEGAMFSASLLPVLGVQPAMGRNFTAAEDSPASNGTVLLSWNLWKRRFAGSPSILGQSILLDGRAYSVIGVMPSWFAYPYSTAQLWTPASHELTAREMQALDNHNFQAIGRLKPDVSPEQAANELSLITLRIHNAHGNNPFISSGAHARPLLESLVGNVRTPLLILLGATGCVLLIACLNISNLLIARSMRRRRELAIRTALGGSRGELLARHLTENLLVSVAGGALGILLASAIVRWFVRLRHDMPRVDAIHIDGVVLAFSAGLVLLTALFAGLVAAFSSRGDQVLTALQDSSRSHSSGQTRVRLRRVLLILEVGLTVVLLIGAGLLLKSYARLRASNMGCITQNVLTMQLSLPAVRYDFPAAMNFYQELLSRLRHYPGVQGAGLVTTIPGDGYGGDHGFTVQGRPPLPEGKGQLAISRWADPGYFAAMGIPFQSGHTFSPDQFLTRGSELIISKAFQQQYFPGEDPVGQILLTMGSRPYRIAGVVGDTLFAIGEPPRPMMYFPIYTKGSDDPNDFSAGTALVVRSGEDATRFALPVQKTVQSLDRDLAVSDILTMDQVIGEQTVDSSFEATLLLMFAFVSLVLAAVGLFGVVSYIAAQRTTEIGVRIALGAQRKQVVGLVLRDGLRPALIGLALGLVTAAAVTRLMQSMLYETRPLDPQIFSVVALTLIVVAGAACILPAWRAAKLNPVMALRME